MGLACWQGSEQGKETQSPRRSGSRQSSTGHMSEARTEDLRARTRADGPEPESVAGLLAGRGWGRGRKRSRARAGGSWTSQTRAGQSPAPAPTPDFRCAAALLSLPLSFLSLSLSLSQLTRWGLGAIFGGRCKRAAASFPARTHCSAIFPRERAAPLFSARFSIPRRPPQRNRRLGDAFGREATPYATRARRPRRPVSNPARTTSRRLGDALKTMVPSISYVGK
jgi:hypothetical protein